MDAEDAGLVARGGYDPTRVLATRTADNHREPAQLRPVALLDSGEEGIEVDVEDRSRGHARYHRPAVEPPADEPTARAGRDATASAPPPPGLSAIVIAVAVILAAAWIA